MKNKSRILNHNHSVSTKYWLMPLAPQDARWDLHASKAVLHGNIYYMASATSENLHSH